MAERTLLLGLMRRLRRRRRWVDIATGAALAVAAVGPAVAATIPLLRARGSEPEFLALVAALLTAAIGGAIVAGVRRVPLSACARAVDRTLGPQESGDRVFAAVSFAESEASSPFVAALTAEAWARASVVPPRQIVPLPARRPLVLAVVSVAAVLALSLGPRVPLLASTSPRTAEVGDPRGTTGRRVEGKPALIRLAPASLESEREDAQTAAAAARAAADEELGRLARELALLVDGLSASGSRVVDAVNRAQGLAVEARDAAEQARAARMAAQASKAALSSAGGGRSQRADAAALADTLDAGAAGTAPDAAAAQLAAGGAAGRAALARAAAAAAEALARAAGGGPRDADSAAGGEGDDGAGGGDLPRRRLDEGSNQRDRSAEASGARRAGAQQRRLQQLRRDLERSAADCRRDPEACRRGAAKTGRSLADVGAQGRTAEARSRLAQSAQQLLDRLQRSAGADDGRRMRSFSRAARGERSGAPAGSEPRGAPAGGRDEAEPAAGESASAVESGEDGAGDPDRPGAGEGETEGDGDETGQTSPASPSGRGSSGAAVGGTAAGDAPGGAVLGTRTPGGGGVGRDAPTPVAGSAGGPTRSQVIAGAAARGFSSAEYRRVFTDYAGVIEESLDNTAVPPGRRYLVRRYFQLIRPRGP